MKKVMFAVVSVAFAMSAVAAESDEVVSVDHITVAGKTYDLTTTQKSDGTVCVSYLSETHYEGDKAVATVAQYCERNGDRHLVAPSFALNSKRDSAPQR